MRLDLPSIFYSDHESVRWTEPGTPVEITWSVADFRLQMPDGLELATARPASPHLPVLREAVGLWDAALETVSFRETGTGNAADVTFALSPIDGPWGVFARWAHAVGPDRVIDKAVVRFDPADIDRAPHWLLTTALHEIGNVLGLGDIRPSPAIRSVQEDTFPERFADDALWPDDVALIRAYYGDTDPDAPAPTAPSTGLRLVDRPGDDIHEDGAGRDTVVYDLPRAVLAIAHAGEDAVTVAGPGGSLDRLDGIDRIETADGVVLLDLDRAAAGPVIALFRAAFGRDPAEPGLRHWLSAGAGDDPSALAAAFAASPEFERRHEESEATDFVAGLYRDLLAREPGASGLAHWTGALETGRLAAGEVLAAFAASAEAVQAATDDLADGFVLL